MGLFGRDQSTPTEPQITPSPNKPAPTRSSVGGSRAAEAGTTLIAPAAQLEGALTGTGDVRIEGRLQGTVTVDGHVIVNQGGSIDATIKARVVVVAGEVHGDVNATEKIELQPTARLTGNMTAPKILIQEGAKFEGQVFMEGDARHASKKPSDNPSPKGPSRPDEDTAASKTKSDPNGPADAPAADGDQASADGESRSETSDDRQSGGAGRHSGKGGRNQRK